jgi:DNA-binding MarR family transcriptional regulator
MIDHQSLADQVVTASAKLLRWLRAADTAPALSGPQASALGVIIHSGRIRMSDLARIEEVSRPTITSTALQLEERGLVDRERDPGDGRVSWLRASEKGRQVFFEGQARRVAPLAAALGGLSEADRSALLEACRLLSAMLPGSVEAPADAERTQSNPTARDL